MGCLPHTMKWMYLMFLLWLLILGIQRPVATEHPFVYHLTVTVWILAVTLSVLFPRSQKLSLSSNRSLFSEVCLLFSLTSLSRSHWERELHEAVSAACCFETQLALKWLNSALHFCKCSLELFWLLWNFLPLASVAGISKKHLNKHKRNPTHPWILTCWMLPNEPICCTVIHSLWQKNDMEMLSYICVV